MQELNFCQSCGMPLETPELFGTNADGSQSADYCTYCFQHGSFTQDVNMEGMIAISLSHIKELFKDRPRFNEEASLQQMRQFFPSLKRWKKE